MKVHREAGNAPFGTVGELDGFEGDWDKLSGSAAGGVEHVGGDGGACGGRSRGGCGLGFKV